jgi:hypothetical protein
MTFRHTTHRLLLLVALGLSVWVVSSVVTGGDEQLETIFRETPGRGAGFVVFLACALFFPAFTSLVMVPMSWSRTAVRTGTFTRYFCIFSGLLHAVLARLGPEAPAQLLAGSATVFMVAGITAPRGNAEIPPPAMPDRAHHALGWLLLLASLGLGVWTVAHVLRVDDLSGLWGKNDADILMGALFFPPLVALGMITNRRTRTTRRREQSRVAIRLMCLVAAGIEARIVGTEWGVPIWAPCLAAPLFVVAAAVPWRNQAA